MINPHSPLSLETTLVDRILSGDREAATEYRKRFWWDLTLDKTFFDRMLSKDNLGKLKEAKRIGIPPARIMTRCYVCAPRTRRTLTAPEAKKLAQQLRGIRNTLRKSLPRMVFPMLERPTDYATPSLLPILPDTVPPFFVQGYFPLLDTSSMTKLWEVVGQRKATGRSSQHQDKSKNALAIRLNATKGHLEKLADALEEVIPTLKRTKPAHRPPHLGKQGFAWEWNRLACDGAKRPCDELGTWFFEVTFGKEIDVEAFAKLRKRAKPR